MREGSLWFSPERACFGGGGGQLNADWFYGWNLKKLQVFWICPSGPASWLRSTELEREGTKTKFQATVKDGGAT